MNTNNIIKIALKIGAIVIVVNSLNKLPPFFDYVLYSKGSQPITASTVFGLFPCIFSLIIGCFMWFFPGQLLSNVFLRHDNEESTSVHESIIAELLISILGLYVLTYAIPDMVYHVVFYFNYTNLDGIKGPLRPSDYAAFVTTIFEIVLGAYLIYGSKIVNNFIRQIKKDI